MARLQSRYFIDGFPGIKAGSCYGSPYYGSEMVKEGGQAWTLGPHTEQQQSYKSRGSCVKSNPTLYKRGKHEES